MKYYTIGSPGPLHLELGMLDWNLGGRNLASHRATQASHAGICVLQDNLTTIQGNVKRAPAALFKRISTLVGRLTRKVLTELFRVLGPGSQNSELGIPELGVIGQHKPHTLEFAFCKTT
jgi:hypothetical protein